MKTEKLHLEILPANLFIAYKEQVSAANLNRYETLEDSELSIESFHFYTSVSAVFSSKIEGENIDLDSYVKHKRFGIEYHPDYTKKIDDLYEAYQFAKSSYCSKENILHAHQILTRHILPEKRQGKIRTGNMYVTTTDGKIEYIAVSPYQVQAEMELFYNDLNTLLHTELDIQETFYFAAMLHLVLVKIHPFDDGNGRISRLVEKWFLSAKLGEKVWLIQSEKNYYLHHSTYYKHIRALGIEYEELDYTRVLPFLLMLPQSLSINEQ